MTYTELRQNFKDNFPTTKSKDEVGEFLLLAAKNEYGENVIIKHGTQQWSYNGKTRNQNFFKISTAQHNGWTRHNMIFENGNTEEFYELR